MIVSAANVSLLATRSPGSRKNATDNSAKTRIQKAYKNWVDCVHTTIGGIISS